MNNKQKLAAIILPLLAIFILFGGNTVLGGPDGEVYEGVAQGFAGELRVRVEVAEDEILAIDIVEFNDTEGLGDRAAETIIEKILESQTVDVDVVTGATGSSMGTINAVKDALDL